MTAAQTIQIRLSECRQRLNTLLQIEMRSAKEQTELETLTAEVSQREPELRAALAAEPDPEVRESRLTDGGDSETRERLELRNKSKFGRFIFAAISARAVDGVEAEYAAAEGVSAAGQIPIDLFETRRVETRAVTPSPATAPMQIQAPTVPYVFARSMAARLGVQFPIVQAGPGKRPCSRNASSGRCCSEGCRGPGDCGRVPFRHEDAPADRVSVRVASRRFGRFSNNGGRPHPSRHGSDSKRSGRSSDLGG